MAVCSKCQREIQDKDVFCGYCGNLVLPPHDIVIDGRKNRKIKKFVSKTAHSYKMNLLMLILNFVLILCFSFLSYLIVSNLLSNAEDIKKVMIQIMVKYKYIEEGLSLSYLSRDIRIILKLILNIVFLTGSFIGAFFNGIYAILHILLINNIKKREQVPSKGRPVALLKVYEFTLKFMIFVLIIYVLLLGIFFVINLIV